MRFSTVSTKVEPETKNQRVEDLILRLGKQDMAAMDLLYTTIQTDVYAFALSKCQNPTDAEDVMQDTFVQIYRYAARYTPQGKPLAWVFTIVTSLCNRKFQLAARTTNMDETYEQESQEAPMESRVVESEFLRQLMKTLSPEDQEIIVLHVISGMKHKEIAELLDKPISTVLSRYNRGIKKLQKQVGEVDR